MPLQTKRMNLVFQDGELVAGSERAATLDQPRTIRPETCEAAGHAH